MAVENKETEEVVDEKVDETVESTEPSGDDAKKGKSKETEEVKFDDLPENVRKFIDRERTKASNTAREKAKKEAMKDPEIQKTIREQLEQEANMTAEEKMQETMKEVAKRENQLDAREMLQENGIKGDELKEVLDLVVSEDRDNTIGKTERFIKLFKNSVATATEEKTRELIKSTPKPKTNTSSTKSFKDMSFDERAELKKSDPSRYKAELDKTRRRI